MIPRYEFKIPCALTLRPEIEAWVRLHPAHWRASYPPRQVNNIYFDSPDLQDLNTNLGGVGRREKLRLRWYGPELTCVAGAQLELKCKDGLAGWKEIAFFTGTLDLTGPTWPELLAALREGLEPRARLWLDKRAAPALINAYRRAYYETHDGVLRLTLDTRLRAYDQRFSLVPNLSRPALLSEQLVIELKGSVEDDSARRLSQVLLSLPMRVERYSKYLHGMLAAPDLERIVT
ncbi:MAG: VTC domain-containing protein [Anaerolineales bacterium]